MQNKTQMFQDTKRQIARWLLEIKAVNFRPEKPYKFTSGWLSPVYIDCRWIISFLEARRAIIDASILLLNDKGVLSRLDMVAGGETAGIPYAAWISERLSLPMLYVRKKPKGFGRGSQIEGSLGDGVNILLVEDLATDGASKINFVNALRKNGATVEHIFVVFFYDIFPGSLERLETMGIKMHFLCNWWDILEEAKMGAFYEPHVVSLVEKFLEDPIRWSGDHGGRDTL